VTSLCRGSFVVFAVTHRLLEISNRLGKAACEAGQLGWPENKKGDAENDEQFRYADFTHDVIVRSGSGALVSTNFYGSGLVCDSDVDQLAVCVNNAGQCRLRSRKEKRHGEGKESDS
jgi:hypothetical protein